MAINYDKTQWINNETPVNAQNLNKHEDALEFLYHVAKDIPNEEEIRISNELARVNSENSRVEAENKRVSDSDKKITELSVARTQLETNVTDKLNQSESKVNAKLNEADNKIIDVEKRFQTITASQQQDSEVIDARDGEISLNARLQRDLEKGSSIVIPVEGSYISTESNGGYVQNLEVYGNTYQDPSDLANVKSVGDEVKGHGVYEIPLLCTGNNLLSLNIDNWSNIYIDGGNGVENNNLTYLTSSYVNISNNVVFSGNSNSTSRLLYFYDNDKKYLGTSYSSQARYCRVRVQKVDKSSISYKDLNSMELQLEYGTVATPYEPYVEDKLTILSPVQLEKVGNVVDRIVEASDKIWDVEKNIETLVLDGSNVSGWAWGGLINGLALVETSVVNNVDVSNSTNIMCDKLINNNPYLENEGIMILPSGKLAFKIKTNSQNLSEFAKELEKSNIIIKYPTKTPTFIPLPHSQQVKLRTFAPKTNISSLCEIEPVIKGEVAKSLGATVNTHTQDIDNIYDELERVKKLEESTVSTVSNEGKDFVEVQSTNQGYFEDVVLSGRTLVNLGDKSTKQIFAIGKGMLKSSVSTVGNVYTAIFPKLDKCKYFVYDSTNSLHLVNATNNNIIKFKVLNATSDLRFYVETYEGNASTQHTVPLPSDWENIVVLEGDHTQAPPTQHWEGLASVGEGTNEIVVSSVWGEGNLFDGELERGYIIDGVPTSSGYQEYVRSKNYLRVNSSSLHLSYNNDSSLWDGVTVIPCYDINLKYLGARSPVSIGDNGKLFEGTVFIKIAIKSKQNPAPLDIWDIYLNSSKYNLNAPHKSDEKRILYYDTTDSTWKKPILDGKWENGKFIWGDEVIKHSDGKYYLHKRTEKSPYVAGDESKADCVTDMTTTVKKLATEIVYEATNIDLITYADTTHLVVKSGVLCPNITASYNGTIMNVVTELQRKVSVLESNVKETQAVQDMVILESDMRILDLELALMEYVPMQINLRGSDTMFRSATYFNFLKGHIENETYSKEYLENVMNKYLATNRIDQTEYDELYKMLYPPVYDIPTELI